MMRSLYSAVSGLKTHQTRMDVIGNNIANVNTEAFKSSRVTFTEIMYQTTASASGGNAAAGVGGINAKQIGIVPIKTVLENCRRFAVLYLFLHRRIVATRRSTGFILWLLS